MSLTPQLSLAEIDTRLLGHKLHGGSGQVACYGTGLKVNYLQSTETSKLFVYNTLYKVWL